MKKYRLIALGIPLIAAAVLLSASGLAQMPQALSQVKITLSSGSILDGNVVYCQSENAEFLLEADASCYVFAFLVSPRGNVKLAFPNAGHPFDMIKPHQPVRIPDDGYYQGVGVKAGWGQFVVVASDDPSWAYSLNEFYAPRVWDSSVFSGWGGAGSSSIANSSNVDRAYSQGLSSQSIPSEMRSELRDEIAQSSASQASESSDLILARARAAVEGYRFVFAKQGFYVATSVSASYTGPTAYYNSDNPSGGYWYVYHDDLSPYGYWEFVGGFGYVWRPYDVSPSWAPYYYGRWVYTVDGWTWVSTEPWGWITYHYGYWAHTHRWGWLWIPGYTWAPARVSWYWSDGYVAWRPAPLPPEINVSFGVELDECPLMVVDREHLTAMKVEDVARPEHLKAEGDALLATDGSRIEQLSDPTPERQMKLARGPVSTLEVVPTEVDHLESRLRGYYRVDNQQLFVAKPTLRPTAEQIRRFGQLDRLGYGLGPGPQPQGVKPKPKKKAPPHKDEPKKADGD